MTLPNFIMIGAAKCGSTSLHSYLKQHPDIYMCPREDANFFALEGGLRLYLPAPPGNITVKWVYRIDEYAALFEDVSGQKAIGESSNLYLNVGQAAERIRHYCPDARIVAILRNPVDRAFSNYLHLKEMGLEPSADLAEAVRLEPVRMKEGWHPMWFYRETGFYHKLLQPYFERFDRNRIGIFLYDDLVRDGVALVQSVYEFLGVDRNFRPDVSKIHKSTGVPRNESLHAFIKKRHPLKSLFKPFVPEKIRKRIYRNVSKKILSRNLYKPVLSDQLRKEMMGEYKGDVLKLQKLINRDLSHWLEAAGR